MSRSGWLFSVWRSSGLSRSGQPAGWGGARRGLAAVLLLALALRVAAVFLFPSLHHGDENFQTMEIAHRLAFGYGATTWEFEDGLRSLVAPTLMSWLFRVVEPVLGGPQGYIDALRIALAAISLFAVAAVYGMGLRTSRTHALFAGLVAATWFELVYFSSRPLSESLAADALLPALAMASRPPAELDRRRLAAIGLCLGLTAALRVQLVVGALFAVFYVGWAAGRRRWLWLAAGAAIPILAFGAVDWATWGAPFHSYVEAIRVNLVEGRSSVYGTHPVGWYFALVAVQWGFAVPILAALLALRARASWLWIGAAAAIVASHLLVAHKEYRFLFPALACLIVVAAMASADLVEAARRRWRRGAVWLAPLAAVAWCAVSAWLAFAPAFAPNWFRSRALIELSFRAAQQERLCGLALYDDSWVHSGGYAHLHRDIPIYAMLHDRPLAQRSTPAFNAVLLRQSSAPDFAPEFTIGDCVDDRPDPLCLAERAGECRLVPGLIPLQQRRRLGEDPTD